MWVGMGRDCRSGTPDRAPTIERASEPRRPYWLRLGGNFEYGDHAVGALLVFGKSGSAFFDGRENSVAIVVERAPGFAEYEQKTDRVIPVFELAPEG